MSSLEPELKKNDLSSWVVGMVAATGIKDGEPWGWRGKVGFLIYLLAYIHFHRSHLC